MLEPLNTTFRDIEAPQNVFSQASRKVIRMTAMSLGTTLKQFRKAAGLSQTELAVACEWGPEAQNRISNYECDTREPSLANLGIMARAMGVSTLDIIAATEDPANYALLTEIAKLDPKQKNVIRDLVASYDPGPRDKK